MREILFKAKKKNWRELPKEQWWVEGYYVRGEWFLDDKEIHVIIPTDVCFYPYCEIDGYDEIDSKTLCQYTGKRDKNDTKIWENDILNGDSYPFLSNGVRNYFAEVTWFDNCSAFGIYVVKNPLSNVNGISEGNTELMEEWNSSEWEVVGNTFDNPELLESEPV